jgi:predicted transcriptional regulator
MATLPKAIYMFNIIYIKIPIQLLKDMEREIMKFTWKNKNNQTNRIAKTILNNKITLKKITIPDLRLYYKAVVIKMAWYWYRDSQVDQWNKIEDSAVNPHSLIFDKEE